MKAVWITDIHLNFLSVTNRREFYEQVKQTKADIAIVTGDIGEAANVCIYLDDLRNHLDKNQKVYFVAGNHDYYYSNIEHVKEKFDKISHGQICYLPHEGVVHLTEDTSLIGVDGWADGRYGDYENSPVILNDSRLIADLSDGVVLKMHGYTKEGKAELLKNMQRLADKDAEALADQLENFVMGERKKVIILTHIPPFPQASRYEDRIANKDFLPFYTCKAVGDVIMEYATRFPQINFRVFCGHSHNKALYEPLPNLTVKCGAAEYYVPKICEVFDV